MIPERAERRDLVDDHMGGWRERELLREIAGDTSQQGKQQGRQPERKPRGRSGLEGGEGTRACSGSEFLPGSRDQAHVAAMTSTRLGQSVAGGCERGSLEVCGGGRELIARGETGELRRRAGRPPCPRRTSRAVGPDSLSLSLEKQAATHTGWVGMNPRRQMFDG